MEEKATFNQLIISEETSDVELAEIKSTMPHQVIAKYHTIPESLLEKSGEEIEKTTEIGFSDWKIKKSFWKTYKYSAKAGKRMLISKVISGITNNKTFTGRFLNCPHRLAWLLSPSTPYQIQVETLLDRSVERYEELISMKITTRKKVKINGEETTVEEVDPKKAMVLLSVIKNLEERALGGAVQRQLSISTKKPAPEEGQEAEVDMSAVDRRLKELEEKLGNPTVDIIDV